MTGDARSEHRDRAAATIWAAWAAVVAAVSALAVAAGTVTSFAAVRADEPFVFRDGPLWTLRSWDAGWYLHLADAGYPDRSGAKEFAFFPVWPLLLRAGGTVLGDPVWAGAVFVALASLAAFIGLPRLAPDQPAARIAVALACLPGSFSLLLLYADALSLALAVWACVLARGRRPLLAVLPAVLCGATRPNGVLLAAALLAVTSGMAWRSRALLAAAPAVGAAAVYAAFWSLSGSPTAFTEAQSRWERGGPLQLVDEFRRLAHTLSAGYAIQLLELAVAVVLVWWLYRMGGAGRRWVPYCALVIGLSVLSGSVQSIGRQAIFAFPIVFAFAGLPPWVLRYALPAGAVLNVALLLTIDRFWP